MGQADHLKVFRGFYWHHGVDAGNGRVIHYTGEVARKSDAAVKETDYETFAKDTRVDIVRYRNPLPDDEVLKRARSRIGEDDYNIAFNNCEHFASWCKTGTHRSSQVTFVAKGAGKVGGAVALHMNGEHVRAAAAPATPAGLVLGIANLGVGLYTAYQVTSLRKELRHGFAQVGNVLAFQGEMLSQLLQARVRQEKKLDWIVHQLFQVRGDLRSVVNERRKDEFRLGTEAVLTARDNLLLDVEHDGKASRRELDALFQRSDDLRNYAKARLSDPNLPLLARQPLLVALVHGCIGRVDAHLFEDGPNASAKACQILLECAETIREEVSKLHTDATPWNVYAAIGHQVEVYANLYRSLYLAHEAIEAGDYSPVADSLRPWELVLDEKDETEGVEELQLRTVRDYQWFCRAFELDPDEFDVSTINRLTRPVLQERLGMSGGGDVSSDELRHLLLPETWRDYQERITYEFGTKPDVKLLDMDTKMIARAQQIDGARLEQLPVEPHEGQYHVAVYLEGDLIEFRALFNGGAVTFENKTAGMRPPRRTARVAPGRLWFEVKDNERRVRIEWTSEGVRVELDGQMVDAPVEITQMNREVTV